MFNKVRITSENTITFEMYGGQVTISADQVKESGLSAKVLASITELILSIMEEMDIYDGDETHKIKSIQKLQDLMLKMKAEEGVEEETFKNASVMIADVIDMVADTAIEEEFNPKEEDNG